MIAWTPSWVITATIARRVRAKALPGGKNLPAGKATRQKQTFNQQWSVQRKGTLITQKLPGPKYSRHTEDMRVWFSSSALTNRIEETDWVFVEAPGAYAAVRPVVGGCVWEQSEGHAKGDWLRCLDDSTPIIMEVARKASSSSYAAFRSAVLSMPLTFKNRKLNYTGLSGDSFTFYADYSHTPEINGTTVNYSPPKVFDSSFIQSQWNSGRVTIQKGSRKYILDFNLDGLLITENNRL